MTDRLACKTTSLLAVLILLVALLGCEDSAGVWVEDDQTIADSAADETLADLADTPPPQDVAPACTLPDVEKFCAAGCQPHEECGDCGCQLNCGVDRDWGSVHLAEFAQTKIALPPGYTMTQHEAASAATFSKASDGVFGFTVLRQAESENAEKENALNLVAIAKAGNLPTVAFSQLFTTPDALWNDLESFPDELRATGVRARIMFGYGVGMPNAELPSKDPAVLRDELVSAISGQVVSTGESSLACEKVQVYWLTQLRPGGSLVTSALLTCSQNFDANEHVQFAFGDLLSGTTVAPASFGAEGTRCEEQIEPANPRAKLDFLWVIDNSANMASVQQRVTAAAIEHFFAQMSWLDADWRVAVTTTEAYGIAKGLPLGASLDHDELLDRQSGLRGVGFISSANPDARVLLEQYLSWDEGCDVRDSSGNPRQRKNQNLCGSNRPDGLASAAIVLERAQVAERESYRLRPNSWRIVVWVSTNENESFIGLDPAGLGWSSLKERYIGRFDSLEVLGFATIITTAGLCVSDRSSEVGKSYFAVLNALNGSFQDICSDRLDRFTEFYSMGDTVLRPGLRRYPISPSIQVLIDGAVVPRSHAHGWDYDQSINTIEFNGVLMDREVAHHIVISYSTWE